MSRYLLEPGNNTMSHIAKCLALRDVLTARGHEVFVAVTAQRAKELDRMAQSGYIVVPDIQEADGGPAPGFSWFRPKLLEACVRAEAAVIDALKPDRVLGVFRFTGSLSARLTGVSYDSLICGSMTPACTEVLGFAPDETGVDSQAAALSFFRSACARRIAPALKALHLPPVDDVWQLLVGRHTFLWDFPEFQPLPDTPGYRHVGPLAWSGWPSPCDANLRLDRLKGPMAFVAFGTGHVPQCLLRHLIEALWQLGYSVALALGGRSAGHDLPVAPERLAVFDFLPVDMTLTRASLVVCHGGQMLLFEAMQQHVPVFVLPLQPEQAQNGRCVERMGCGSRLLRGIVYSGSPSDTVSAFLALSTAELAARIAEFLADGRTDHSVDRAAAVVAHYSGVEALATALEDAS